MDGNTFPLRESGIAHTPFPRPLTVVFSKSRVIRVHSATRLSRFLRLESIPGFPDRMDNPDEVGRRDRRSAAAVRARRNSRCDLPMMENPVKAAPQVAPRRVPVIQIPLARRLKNG